MQASRAGDAGAMENHLLVREAVCDDMVWLVRYGDPYLQVGAGFRFIFLFMRGGAPWGLQCASACRRLEPSRHCAAVTRCRPSCDGAVTAV